MLPNNPNEGNPETPAGAAEQPTSPASPAQGQPLPDYVTALRTQIAELNTQIKGLQKGTDKQIGQVRSDVKRILELKEQGLNESQIQRELWIDQQMGGQSAPPPEQPAGSGPQPGQSLDADSMIASLKFEPNDPALAALKIKFSADPKGLVSAAADLRLSQLNSPKPTPATTPSMQGGAAGTGNDTAALITELQSYQKNPSAHRVRMKEITKILEGRGWQ